MFTGKKIVRRSGVAALAATSLVALAGCGTASTEASSGGFSAEYDGPAVTIEYWNGFTGGDGPFMNALVDEFMAEHENITVKTTTIKWGDFYQKLPAAVSAGEGPDVGVMHLDQLASMAARNVIQPVDDIANGVGLTADDFSEKLWDAGVYEDKRYGIPLDVHSLAMYYNTEHFAKAGITEPPTDAASFADALAKLKAAGYENPFWMPSKWPAHLMELSLIWQNGGEPYAADGASATFDSDAAVDGLAWMRSIIDEGYSPADVAPDSQYVAFKNGQTSITWDGIWQINDLDASGLPYAAAPVPTIGKEAAVWANSHNFFLARQAKADANRLAASQVFIAWMSEHSADWAGAGMIPARNSVRAEALAGTVQEPIAELFDQMRFLPAVPGLGSVQAETLEVAVADGILGSTSPAEALKREADRATTLMEENLAKFGG